jgi:phosphonate transport system substrate-binding protein
MVRLLQFILRITMCAVIMITSLWAMNAQAEVVKIGLADTEDNRPHYKPLLDHLRASSAHSFELVFYSTVEELYRDFKIRKIRLAFLGPVLYAEAHLDIGAIPLLKDTPNTSVFFVRKGSSLRSFEDLRGKRIAFGYPESTTSNLIPRMMLWQHKIGREDLTDKLSLLKTQPQKIYFEYAGSHQGVVDAVLAGTSDVGAALNVYFERNESRGLVAIKTSEPYPGVPLACWPNETPSFISEMRKIFTSYKAPAESPYHHFKNGVTVASDADYDAIRYLCNIVLKTNY